MKGYNDFDSVEELLEYYHIKNDNMILETNTKIKGEPGDKPEKVQQQDKIEVIYAGKTKTYNNIFKNIIVFTNDDDQEDEYNDEDETENSEEKPKLTFEKAASLTASERSAKSMYIVSKEALGVLQKKGYTLKSFTELCKQHGESFDYITNAEELEAKIDVLENCR